MTESKDPLPTLDELQRKIDEAKALTGNEKHDGSAVPPQDQRNAMRLGTDLLSGVAVGGVIGYLLDRHFETSPVLFILFFLLGFAAGVRNILRGVKKDL